MVVLDLLVEALARMGQLYNPAAGQPACEALRRAPPHVRALVEQVRPLAERGLEVPVEKAAQHASVSGDGFLLPAEASPSVVAEIPAAPSVAVLPAPSSAPATPAPRLPRSRSGTPPPRLEAVEEVAVLKAKEEHFLEEVVPEVSSSQEQWCLSSVGSSLQDTFGGWIPERALRAQLLALPLEGQWSAALHGWLVSRGVSVDLVDVTAFVAELDDEFGEENWEAQALADLFEVWRQGGDWAAAARQVMGESC